MVKVLIDAENQSRQNITYRLRRYINSRVSDLVLVQHLPLGRWTAATYAVLKADAEFDVADIFSARRGQAEPIQPDGGHRRHRRPDDPYHPREDGWVSPSRAHEKNTANEPENPAGPRKSAGSDGPDAGEI
jgi:hypothetical protein